MRRDLPPELSSAIDQALDPRPERRPRPEELAAVFRQITRELSDEGALESGELREPARSRLRTGLRGRAVAAATAAGLTFAALSVLAPPTLLQPVEAAAASAAAVALLPRLGWIAMAFGLCAWFLTPAVAREGMAVVLFVALAPIPFLVAGGPALWSLPVAGPVLAALGAGPAYPALAGQAATWSRRAALGAIGFLWVGLAEAAIRHPLLFGLAGGQHGRGDWLHDGVRALSRGIAPLLVSPLILCAPVWAAFAAVLPLMVRGTRLAADVLAAAVWSTGLYAATIAVSQLAGRGPHPRGAVVGAVLAGVVAVAAAAARRRASQAADGP
jgi:hypothetical protein